MVFGGKIYLKLFGLICPAFGRCWQVSGGIICPAYRCPALPYCTFAMRHFVGKVLTPGPTELHPPSLIELMYSLVLPDSSSGVGEYLGFQLRQFNHPAQCSALPVCSRVS